jgi:serine/threonine protein phosphatase PrpC
MKFSLTQDSRIGSRRLNQDRLGRWQTGQAMLMVVADGMGGHPHGEVAAQVAVDIAGGLFVREATPRLRDPGGFLTRLMTGAHEGIWRAARERGMAEAPRTVIVACLVQDGLAYWTHVGDCRLYFFRQGRVVARTRDHSFVQQLIDQGRIREEAAATHPQRNLLLQCLGGMAAPQPDAPTSLELEKDDIVVLCSDGFWGPITQRQFLTALLARPLEEAIPQLVALAESRAGARCDNVTVMAMRWNEG